MTTPSIRVGDIGTLIQRTVKENGSVVDVSGADVALIIVRPDGTKVERDMVYVTDGTDGEMEYKVTDNDSMWTVVGTYISQCIVRWGPADDFASNEVRFTVRGRREM